MNKITYIFSPITSLLVENRVPQWGHNICFLTSWSEINEINGDSVCMVH